MTKHRSDRWSEDALRIAVAQSTSVRQVLFKLDLRAAGGNYVQFEKYKNIYSLDTSHFTGKGWNKGKAIPREPVHELHTLLTVNSYTSLVNLKKRLFREGLLNPKCEECGWAKKSADGRCPVELDHINGDRFDNRLCNLRILCPNCHSLKPTHRGSNIGRRSRGGEIGIHATLKTL